MKRRLLLGAMLLGSFFTLQAQSSCVDAYELTETTTITVDAITGAASAGCWNTNGTMSNWYSFVPTENALVRINSNLDVNEGGDTRISIFSGECGALTCEDGNDDVDDVNYLSDITFQAVVGTTYYITFDNRWEALGFDFEVTITPTTCFSPLTFGYAENPTFTTAAIEWLEPATGTPEGYEFEYGLFGFEQGTGTLLELDENLAQVDQLTSGTDYQFYLRTKCSDNDYSEWLGPITFTTAFEPANLNYAYGFETTNLNGFTLARTTAAATGAIWGRGTAFETVAPAPIVTFEPQEGDFALQAGNFGAASDTYAISRGINVAAGQVVTISYWVKKTNLEGNPAASLGVYRGTAATIAAQTTTVRPLSPLGLTAQWTQLTNTFTATTAGVQYISFRYVAAAQVQTSRGYVAIDNVTITSPTAGVDTADLKGFSVFPNPASNVVTVANANAVVNSLVVADLNGRTVKTAKFDGVNEATVNVSDLASGVYMLTISSDKGTTTRKIVKN